MKKALLSGSLILVFILYGLHQRNEESGAVVAPPNLAALTEPSPTNSPLPTATADFVATGASPSPTSTRKPTPTRTPTPTPTATPTGKYKAGTYTGNAADAYYGYIQVRAHINTSGKISAVDFLQYPNDRSNSVRINQIAMPYLQQEAIIAQSSNVDIISGASDTSQAFIESLSYALSQAK